MVNIQSLYSEGAIAEVIENQIRNSSEADAVQAENPLSESEISSGSTVITEDVGPDLEKNGNIVESSEQSGVPSQKEATTKGLYLL